MTIANETCKIQTTCDGIATNYIYDFKIFADADLLVIVTDDTTNVETVLTLNSDYTVNGAGDAGGGSIDLTLASLAPSGSTITMVRHMDIIQATDLVNGDTFDMDTIEDAFDKLTMIAQQLDEKLSRAILLPQSTLITPWTLLQDSDAYTLLISVTNPAVTPEVTNISTSEAHTLDVSGAITLVGTKAFRICTIDTFAAAATDNLESIIGGAVGELIVLQPANNQRAVVCKKGTSLDLQADFTLNNVKSKMLLVCISSGVFHEVSRAKNT